MEILNTPLSQLKQPEFFPECWKTLLTGVIAFVDVRTGSDNRSKSIASELERLGATVVTSFSKKVTHVIFKDGSKPIYDKAKALGIPIVSYLWVVACKDKGEIVSTEEHAAINTQDYDSPFFKWRKVKSMQPKDLEEELKIVERRLDRRRKKMRESLMLNESKDEEPPLPYTPIIERKPIIDVLIESSPLVQERIHQELASGKTYEDVFTINEKEEDDFDTYFNTPLMIKFISKNYFSPRDPPPLSIRKIISDVKKGSTPGVSTPSLSANDRQEPRQTPTQESALFTASKSPLSQSNTVKSSQKRKTRSSIASVAKKRKENTEEAEEKLPRRKLLFQSKQLIALPQDPLVALTPDDSPKRIKKAHPCFSQPSNIHLKSNGVQHQKNTQPAPTSELSVTPPRRDSLADFRLSSVRKKSEKKFTTPTMVCTSLHSETIAMVEKAIGQIRGFTLTDVVNDSTTHVVCGDTRRTLNVMRGVIRGVKIVSIDWVTESLASDKWVDEGKYSVPRFSAAAALYTRNKFFLFKNVGPIYVSPKSPVPQRELCDLIKCGGGDLTIVSKKASIIVGFWKPQAIVPCVTGTWILDCIEKGIVLPLTDYLITS